MADEQVSRRRRGIAMLLSALLGLGFGYLVLEVLLAGMALVWDRPLGQEGNAPAWYLIAVLVAAAVLVYLIRRLLGDSGHSPLGGIAIRPLTTRQYLDAILAIAVSLVGGAVLGPEVALVATGAVIGGLVAGWLRIGEPTRIVMAGAGGAILALFIGPLLTGSLSLDDPSSSIAVEGIAWAIPIAIVVTVEVLVVRAAAGWIDRATGTRPNAWVLLAAALAIAACAIAFQSWTGESHTLIVTSGEEYIADLTAIDSATTLLALAALKSIAYAASLGSGFRGGPFFPAMFIGAALGMLLVTVLPAAPPAAAGIAVGVSTAVIATASMDWRIAIVLAAVIAVALGGWALIPAAVLGGIAGWAVRRWADRAISRAPRTPAR